VLGHPGMRALLASDAGAEMNRLRLVNPQLAAVAPAHKFNLDLTTATDEALAGLQGGSAL
jgi:hypothetical protein